MAHRNTVVISLWTPFKMLLTFQILWQSFETNGSYSTTRSEPSRDCKFFKSSRALHIKGNRDKPHFGGWVLLHMPTLGSNSRICWFLLWCTRRMVHLPMVHSKKQIQAENDVYEESHGPFLDLGFVQAGVSRGKLGQWMVKVVKNTSSYTRWVHFWKQNTLEGITFSNVTW